MSYNPNEIEYSELKSALKAVEVLKRDLTESKNPDDDVAWMMAQGELSSFMWKHREELIRGYEQLLQYRSDDYDRQQSE